MGGTSPLAPTVLPILVQSGLTLRPKSGELHHRRCRLRRVVQVRQLLELGSRPPFRTSGQHGNFAQARAICGAALPALLPYSATRPNSSTVAVGRHILVQSGLTPRPKSGELHHRRCRMRRVVQVRQLRLNSAASASSPATTPAMHSGSQRWHTTPSGAGAPPRKQPNPRGSVRGVAYWSRMSNKPLPRPADAQAAPARTACALPLFGSHPPSGQTFKDVVAVCVA